jgi:hypothetical protein
VSPPAAVVDRFVRRVARTRRADPIADRIGRALDHVPAPVRDALHGSWLGIPLHPVLTDVTIGAWTTSFVLDLAGGRSARTAARRFVLLGIVSAVPTVASGAVDWSGLDREARRVGLLHAATNAVTTVAYLRSYRDRIRGHHGRGVAWAMFGATLATAGAHVGGMLVYRWSAGVTRAPEQSRGRPTPQFASESVRIG